MNRREAIRLLAMGVAVPLAPGRVFTALREARTTVGTQSPLRTLNAHQEAIVRTIAELILPRTDTPGASDVGATEFIDLMLTEWYDEDVRTGFLKGLEDVDSRSLSLVGKNFIECSAVQQGAILTALGDQMIAEGERNPDRAQRRFGLPPESRGSFYPMLRRLTLTAYYTSEAGATQGLHFEVIPERHGGCVEEQTDQEAPEQR